MAIVVSYGPIAGALSLAAQAGAGQGYNIQAQRDLQALQLQNSMQSEIDRNHAMEMQNALAYNQLDNQHQYQQQMLAQNQAYTNAQQQMQNTTNQFNRQRAADEQQMQQSQLAERQREFNAQQTTREQQAAALNQLRQAMAQKAAQPPAQNNQAIAANGMALRSMDQEAATASTQLRQLTAALAKASDPYTGDPQQVAALKDQINGIKFSLDGIDPATGKKAGMGLNDKRQALRQMLQNMGSHLSPAATMQPSPLGGFDLNNDSQEEGELDNPTDPLYQVNLPANPQSGMAQPGQAQATGQGQATPAIIAQLGQQLAQRMGSTVADPQVRQAVRQLLVQQGYSIPTFN